MLKLKYRKIIFWVLLAVLAGSSMAIYAESDANFWLKTVGVVLVQQLATVVIFMSCFGWDLGRTR